MPTLFLSAPKVRTAEGSDFYKTFQSILSSGIGPDYGIYSSLIARIHAGDRAVVFDRDQRLQAEGFIAGITEKQKTRNGIQRYDIRIHSLTPVSYSDPPRVNRCGVEVK
jgi:hypothetical protein